MIDYDDANMANFKESEPVNSSMSYSPPSPNDLREALDILQERIESPNASHGHIPAMKQAWNIISDYITRAEPVVSQDQLADFAKWLDDHRNANSIEWRDTQIWSKEIAFQKMLETYRRSPKPID